MDTLGKWGSWGWRGPTHSTDRLAGHPDATGCVEEDWSAWTLLSSSATGSVHCFLSQTPWARSVATAAPRMGDQLLFYVESRVYSDFLAVWSCYVGEVLVTLRSALLAGPLQPEELPLPDAEPSLLTAMEEAGDPAGPRLEGWAWRARGCGVNASGDLELGSPLFWDTCGRAAAALGRESRQDGRVANRTTSSLPPGFGGSLNDI
ncbi:uncharacterized protein [Symphalangus syndactylus]|uniref:uncharacterized protein isoform X2 n=1 Tax=Symphalangus syndactylus TaxID=9590 RepID=UPI003007191D